MPEQPCADIAALSDLRTPWCIHVVATLRIADHIAAGVTDVDALAERAACDSHYLHRVLSHLVSQGVFLEASPGQFALNEAAQALLDPSQRISLDLDGFGGRMAHSWTTLLTVVRTGAPAYREQFGLPFWEDLDAHPAIAASFDALMGPSGHGLPDPEVLVNGDWDSVRTVVDVGGGTGSLLAEILRTRRSLRGTLVDLPRTVTRSDEIMDAAGVGARVKIVGQSFFDPLPPGADLYLLRSVLGNWPDREAAAILRRCAEAAKPIGRVVVLGGVYPDGVPPSLSVEVVLLGGGDRSLTEFRALAQSAGLEVRATGNQPSGRFVVECRPT
jgi:hypothetical protein